MFTKNYRLIKWASQYFSVTGSTSSKTITIPDSFTDVNGDEYTVMYISATSSGNATLKIMSEPLINAIINNPANVRLGIGTTAPSYSDIAMETDVTSQFSNAAASVSNQLYYDNNESGNVINITYSATNTGSSVTITEIGVYNIINTGSSTTKTCLTWRELLDEPITVPSGSSIVFTIQIGEKG